MHLCSFQRASVQACWEHTGKALQIEPFVWAGSFHHFQDTTFLT